MLTDSDNDGVCDEFEIEDAPTRLHATTIRQRPMTMVRALHLMSAVFAGARALPKALVTAMATSQQLATTATVCV